MTSRQRPLTSAHHRNHPDGHTRRGPQPTRHYQAMTSKPLTPGNGVNVVHEMLWAPSTPDPVNPEGASGLVTPLAVVQTRDAPVASV
jgi:hypothetical protein